MNYNSRQSRVETKEYSEEGKYINKNPRKRLKAVNKRRKLVSNGENGYEEINIRQLKKNAVIITRQKKDNIKNIFGAHRIAPSYTTQAESHFSETNLEIGDDEEIDNYVDSYGRGKIF